MGRLESPDCYFRSISVDLQKKRDYIAKILNDAGMDPVVPEGGYFIMANWSKLGRHIIERVKNITLANNFIKKCVNTIQNYK